ncbi:SDR family oxidoreductase [Granulicella sibirica]|uniref:NADPH-dependent methylglyoxal reductase (D-lactaldehyde dehydrogenase) n=1 Tax=Granulicella sibirica TaxID=2479048 RepID=A0A4V1L638_9BACT|nr:aldehyde reductase [Granulicella sibirica]RXH57914.1 NADPH-dependent methylglyoxal reductase (D-lactaldehyde dehydrogenase) [Granulicella sibirica]
MNKTVLVTGGTGFVAGWCVVKLLEQGYTVRTTVRNPQKESLVRSSVSRIVNANERLSVYCADLTSDDGWDEAMKGCDYVLHVASPMSSKSKNPDDLIIPAKEGTLRVLRTAAKAVVSRVVFTSSCAAAKPPLAGPDSDNDESLWTNLNDANLDTYRRSKIRAERSAWDFMKTCDTGMTLATVLPGAILGPVLHTESLGSVQVVSRLLTGRMPGTPRLGFNISDVRDLADLHLLAMTSPVAAGQRFIGTGDFLWMKEIAETLRHSLGEAANKVPRRSLPDLLMRLMARIDPTLRSVTPTLGRKHNHSSAKAQTLLGWKPRPGKDSVTDCAKSLISSGALQAMK